MSTERILQLLATGPATTEQACMLLSATVAKTVTVKTLAAMRKRGLVTKEEKRWALTPTGRAQAGHAQHTQKTHERGVYVPERPPRRPGSEIAARLPSVVSGKRYWPRGVQP